MMTARRCIARPARALWVLALAAVASGLVQACAGPVEWRKPATSEEQWARDRAECRSRARREAEREFLARSSQVGSPVYERGRSLAADLARYDAKRHERRLFERCLEARGYTKSAPAPKGKD